MLTRLSPMEIYKLQLSSPKWVFVVRALETVKGTGAAKDELNKM